MSFKENYILPITHSEAKKIIEHIFDIYPELGLIFKTAINYDDALNSIKKLIATKVSENPRAQYFLENKNSEEAFHRLNWSDFALIRLHDYVSFSDLEFPFHGEPNGMVKNQVFRLLWAAYRENRLIATEDFFIDFFELVKQWRKKSLMPSKNISQLKDKINSYPSGLDAKVQEMRSINKTRIIKILTREIESKKTNSSKYHFKDGLSLTEKYDTVSQWWNDHHFHLMFAIREPQLLNEMLDYSLPKETLMLFEKAQSKGIPFFVNPYYLSLLLIHPPKELEFADRTIRDYIFYSKDFISEYGNIQAWEKEDQIVEGKPNAAGWYLPNNHNIHRRYPEVAIFIPDSIGRSCGGLCVSCQRMYDFQRGNLNFNLDKLKPKSTWSEKLRELMNYFEFDSQLKDILITGGDSLMSSNTTLRKLLEAVYDMALRKKTANVSRKDSEKYAEMERVRLGTRMPAYLPQRIDDELISILTTFKAKATQIGFKEFVIQVHYESPMEITPESAKAIKLLSSAGWMVVNQQVFTVAASRKGYSSKLRMMLNKLGVIPYYTFSVKGFKENRFNFTPMARSNQESIEEKSFGQLTDFDLKNYLQDSNEPSELIIENILKEHKIPFLATDRNVFNLPGIGKSMTYRTIGITSDGRRILLFSHDNTRRHSPSVNSSEHIVLVESKSISSYLQQLETIGEKRIDYKGIYGYSMALTEHRSNIFEYPEIKGGFTSFYTNNKTSQ